MTRDEIAEQFVARMTPYQRNYLIAWYCRKQKQQQRHDHTRRFGSIGSDHGASVVTDATRLADDHTIIRAWLTRVFEQRVTKTHSLIRDEHDRYTPGPTAPRLQTLDGELVAYTPEKRQELAAQERTQSRAHLALMEWQRMAARPEFQSPEARAQVLIFLIRRLVFGQVKTRRKQQPLPLDERKLSGLLQDLLRFCRHARRPAPGVRARHRRRGHFQGSA